MNTEKVLSFFSEIARIPRESGHEEKIVEYLREFAKKRSLDCKVDKLGNVIISKPASKGYEDRPKVILQGHTDMVCEKAPGSKFDFAKDAIKYEIVDGWMIAKETTLGADNGIGVATALSILDSDTIEHPALECLFTVSEETGLDGARGLSKNALTGKFLINMDDEDEGCFCIGCAGGVDTVAKFTFKMKKVSGSAVFTRFSISGGRGGHSGDDIDKNRMNAVQQIARFIEKAFAFGVDVCMIDGGGKRNAIAREAEVVLAIPARKEDDVVALFNNFAADLKNEFADTDPDVRFSAEPVVWKGGAMDSRTAHNLVYALLAVPHGVTAMDLDMPGLIQTSTNLASVKQKGNVVSVGTMQRSSVDSEKDFIQQRVAATFKLAGAEIAPSDGYCGWKPNVKSPLKDICVAAYRKLFNKEPIVHAIHGGLECGLFTQKFPDIDMIAFGPTIVGPHAPGEKLDLASLDRFYSVLLEVLKSIR